MLHLGILLGPFYSCPIKWYHLSVVQNNRLQGSSMAGFGTLTTLGFRISNNHFGPKVSVTDDFVEKSFWEREAASMRKWLWGFGLSAPHQGYQVHPFWKAAISLLQSCGQNWMNGPCKPYKSLAQYLIFGWLNSNSMTENVNKAHKTLIHHQM